MLAEVPNLIIFNCFFLLLSFPVFKSILLIISNSLITISMLPVPIPVDKTDTGTPLYKPLCIKNSRYSQIFRQFDQ